MQVNATSMVEAPDEVFCLPCGESEPEVVGVDPFVDPSSGVAVLQVEALALAPLPLGDSDGVRLGDPGILCAVDRPLAAPNDAESDQVIRTDAALNRSSAHSSA